MGYWYVEIGPLKDPRLKNQEVSLVANVLFKCDGTVKGIAVFDSQDNAQAFLTATGMAGCSLPLSCIAMRTKADVTRWMTLLRFCCSPRFVDLAIYVNPADPYAIGDRSDHPSFYRFLATRIDDLVDWQNPVESISMHDGHTIAVLAECDARKRGRGDKAAKYACQVVPGRHPTASAFRAALEAIAGTSDERSIFVTPWCGSIKDAVASAHKELRLRAAKGEHGHQ